MVPYAAFDVSDKETAIHVLDEHGKSVWKGKRPSEPEALAAALRRHAPELERVGLEAGQLAPWLYHALKALGMPVVCRDARHARAATALQRNKMVCPGRGRVRRDGEQALRQDGRAQLEREVAPCTFAVWMCRCGRRPSAPSTVTARS